MIIAKNEYGDNFDNIYSKMPAYIQNGVLVIGHNGNSERERWLCNSEWYDSTDFEYFCNHIYYSNGRGFPQFLYKGKIPYELMTVSNGLGGEVLFTYLTPCRNDTYFCRCDDCGEIFVIDCYKTVFYKSRNLTLPTVRCKDCIAKRKKEK